MRRADTVDEYLDNATLWQPGLRPGQRREYADYVADAKREQTRRRRIGKILPMILDGVGLNDRYTR